MERSKFREPSQHPNLDTYEVLSQNTIPIDNTHRKCTDILCIIIGLALTITLSVFAIILFNRPQYEKQVFPADTDGFTCGHEYPGYNYLYFAKPTELKNRVCVSSCPKSKDEDFSCKKTSSQDCKALTYYPTQAVQNEYGYFCLPKDQGQKKTLQDQMRSYSKDLYYNSVRTIQRSLVVIAIASVLYMLLVQCFPRAMWAFAVVVGTIALIGLAITILVYPSNINAPTRFIVFGLVVLTLLVLACTIASNVNLWKYNRIFLVHATHFVGDRLYTMLLPFVFLGLGVAFYFFELYEYRSFWSYGALKFDPSVDLYHRIANPTTNYLLSAFQLIQILWGTFFLKQAFNYLISAETVQWYYGKGSACANGVFTLVCKHLGSVIACAFMNAFFSFFDFVFDAIIPSAWSSSGNPCFQCLQGFASYFDLVRSDAMAFVYLTGNAYCNSARYCDYIVDKNPLTHNSQGLNRIYRLCSHFALGGIICILAFWVLNLGGEVSISGMGILLLLCFGVSTFFISLHADAAEAITILYLTQEQYLLSRGQPQTTQQFQKIRDDINQTTQTGEMRKF